MGESYYFCAIADECVIVVCCACVYLRERGEESVRYSQSQGVDGASRGSCALGDHYCNEGSMAATLAAGPQAALYN